VIPDTATEKPIFGKVVAVGKGKILENATFARSTSRSATRSFSVSTAGGTEVKMDGDELVMSCR